MSIVDLNLTSDALAASIARAALKLISELESAASDNLYLIGNAADFEEFCLGFTYQKEKEAAQTSVPVLTDIRGGRSVTIEAVSGDLTSHGAQIAAGYGADGNVVISDNDNAGDITLKAGKDIILESAQATDSSSTSSASGGASFGVSAGIGINGVSGGLTGGADASVGKSNANGPLRSILTSTALVTSSLNQETIPVSRARWFPVTR
ncbi:hypothetical protein ACVITL_006328 [Rhizobium pisi]|jgi:filamentous hemagglutinin